MQKEAKLHSYPQFYLFLFLKAMIFCPTYECVSC